MSTAIIYHWPDEVHEVEVFQLDAHVKQTIISAEFAANAGDILPVVAQRMVSKLKTLVDEIEGAQFVRSPL